MGVTGVMLILTSATIHLAIDRKGTGTSFIPGFNKSLSTPCPNDRLTDK